MQNKPKILEKLRNARLSKNYSYLDMANFLAISKTFYWQIENGYRRLTYEMAKQIAGILNTKPDNLFFDEF